eukprot:sb/3474870/
MSGTPGGAIIIEFVVPEDPNWEDDELYECMDGAETRPMDGGGDETLSREWWTIKRGDTDGPPANLEQWANAPDKGGNIPDKDRTLSGEWWTLKPGDAPAPRFGDDDVSEDEEDDDVYDNVDELKMISSSSSE